MVQEAIQRRKLARKEWLIDTNNEITLRRFRTRQKEATKILRCEKRKYVQNILEKQNSIIKHTELGTCISE